MSQFRTEDMNTSTGELKSSRELHQTLAHSDSIIKPEPHDVSVQASHTFTSGQVRPDYSEEYIAKAVSNEYPANKQSNAEYTPKPNAEFSALKQHDVYHPKQLHNETDRVSQSDVDENYGISKMEPKLTHAASGSVPFPGQSRFLSGQTVSQAIGPTPTLNQLLQASSPVHRFHSSYSSVAPESYQQSWPIQRPAIVPPVYPQPNQRPPQTV